MGNFYFTSDLHFGDDRLKIFSRDLFFKSMDEMHQKIIDNFNQSLSPDDILVIVGDVCYDKKYIDLIDKIICNEKILIIGNHDEDKLDILESKFSVICENSFIQLEYKENDYFGILITHKPTDIVKAKTELETLELGICGHIHGLWKVQKNPIPIVNVSVDVWNFKPIPFTRILDQYHGIKNYYDENVFLEEACRRV